MLSSSNWFIITVIRVRLDPLARNDQSSAQHFCHLRLAHRQKLQLLAILLVQIEQHLLAPRRQNELLLVHLQHSVPFFLLVVIAHLLFHDQLEVVVVNCKWVPALDQNWVVKGVKWSQADLQFVDFLQAIFSAGVDRVNRKLFIRHDVQFGLVGHLSLFHFSVQVIISNFFGVKIKKANLCFGLGLVLVTEDRVSLFGFSIFWKSYCDDSVKRVQLDWVKGVGANDFSFLDFFFFILDKGTPPENVLFELLVGAFALFEEDEADGVVVADNSGVDVDFVLKFEYGLFGDFAILFQIINFHLVVLLHMVLILFLPAGSGLNQQAHLSVIDFNNALDFFRRKMINRAFLWFFPAQDVIGLSADSVWLAAEVEIQFFKFEFFWGFVGDWSWVLLEFPFFEADVWKGEDFVFLFGVENYFVEVLAFVDDLRNLFTAVLADNVDAAEMHLRVSLFVDVLQLSDRIGPRVLFLMPFQWINLDHLVGALPKNVNLGIAIDWHNYSQLEFFLSAFFVWRELQSRDFVCFYDFALLADFPRMQQLDFLFLQIGSDQCKVIFVGLDVLDYGLELVWLDDLGGLDTEDVKGGHAQYHCKVIIEFAQLGTVLILLAQEWNLFENFKLINTEHEQIGAIDIQQKITDDQRCVHDGPGTVELARDPERLFCLLLHSRI